MKRPVGLSSTPASHWTKRTSTLTSLSEEFDKVGGEIIAALDHFSFPHREKDEFLAAIVAQKNDVVNA